MSKLVWDQIGERLYETGVDRGVIYPIIGGTYSNGEAWNGLSDVEENPSGAEPTALYANNHKYMELMSAEEFGFTVKAFTYPKAFAKCNGEAEATVGVYVTQQARQPFGLTYRNLIGNDVKKNAYGYKLHLVYGAMASPAQKTHSTINEDPNVEPMSWECTTTAVDMAGFEPTAHLIIDSTTVDPAKLKELEEILYGKDSTSVDADDGKEPRLPLPDEVVTLMETTV